MIDNLGDYAKYSLFHMAYHLRVHFKVGVLGLESLSVSIFLVKLAIPNFFDMIYGIEMNAGVDSDHCPHFVSSEMHG